MKRGHLVFGCLIAAVSLAGCAGSVSAPMSVQGLSVMQRTMLRLSDISADATNGVEMGDTDFQRITELVRNYIQEESLAF